MKIFYIDKSFFIFLFIIILCGLFNNFIVYFLLLIIHELGHALIGTILGYKLDRIKIYPYGGLTLFKSFYNSPLKKELFVLLGGPLFQIIAYLLLRSFIHYDYLIIYHYTLLIFNLLPIYPLDGGKLLNIFLNYFFNYQRSFYISYYISLIILILLIGYSIYIKNYNLIMIIIILIIKLIKHIKEFDYVYNKFLLERYLYQFKFKNIKCISNEKAFYRDNNHIIKMEKEEKFLDKYFNN